MKATVLFPNVATGGQVSHVCFEICGAFPPEADTHIHCHALEKGFRSPVARPAFPPTLAPLAWRIDRRMPFVRERTSACFLRDAARRPGVAILWPGAVNDVARTLRRQNLPFVMEMINCHQGTARRILDDAFARVGLPPEHGLTQRAADTEQELYELADAVFSPSPMTRLSLLEHGIPENKIIDTAFGWSPQHNAPATAIRRTGPFTAISAGTVCIRKGAHLLAAAWRDAALPDARLQFAGGMTADFAGERIAWLTGPGIELLGHRPDLPALMAAAHVFAFPTLEEGGPIVTYEAAALGLAIVTTPMGAGAIVRDGIEALVVDPFDHDGWVNALRRLATDDDLRARLGAAAQARAQTFTFAQTAVQRHAALTARFGA